MAQKTAQAEQPPYIVEPIEPHTYTILFLHGLGSNGEKFGRELLDTGVTSQGPKLIDLLPNARWVFPTARRPRSTAFNRSVLNQWFDKARIEDPSYRKEVQLKGLGESAEYLLGILQDELRRVPPERLILGGLSQGCAMSVALLLCLEHPIGGYIGMCGYLTYQSELELAIKGDEFDGEDDPFARDGEEKALDPVVKAQVFERDLLSLEALGSTGRETTAFSTPVFLGHGSEDEKVPCQLGARMAELLRAAEHDVVWKRYEGLGHWYRIPEEIDDIVEFIRTRVGWSLRDSTP